MTSTSDTGEWACVEDMRVTEMPWPSVRNSVDASLRTDSFRGLRLQGQCNQLPCVGVGMAVAQAEAQRYRVGPTTGLGSTRLGKVSSRRLSCTHLLMLLGQKWELGQHCPRDPGEIAPGREL